MGKSAYAELINRWDILISGLKKNEKELNLPVKTSDFEKLVNDARSEDKIQEDFKAKTQQSTERLNKLLKDLKEKSARIVSGVHAQYGKRAEKLEEFGLKPLKSGRKKGSSATPSA
jgi:Skp family chaperone for outer membrane proteins